MNHRNKWFELEAERPTYARGDFRIIQHDNQWNIYLHGLIKVGSKWKPDVEWLSSHATLKQAKRAVYNMLAMYNNNKETD